MNVKEMQFEKTELAMKAAQAELDRIDSESTQDFGDDIRILNQKIFYLAICNVVWLFCFIFFWAKYGG